MATARRRARRRRTWSTRIYGLDVTCAEPLPGCVRQSLDGRVEDVSVILAGHLEGSLPGCLWTAKDRRTITAADGTQIISRPADTACAGEFQTGDDGPREDCKCDTSTASFIDPTRLLGIGYPEGVRIVIDHPVANIWCAWRAPATLEDAATYLIGPILAFAARRRGGWCIHGSAVAKGGALAARGFAVLTDDVAVVRPSPAGFGVEPGPERLCLWPDAAEALYGPGAALPRITPAAPAWDKRYAAARS